MVPTFWRALLPAFLWEDTDLEPRGGTRRSEGKGELSSGPGTPGDRASSDRLSLRKGPVFPQEEISGRQHNRDPGPCPVSLPWLPNAWTPYSALSPGSGCSGGPRPLWVLCLPPRSPTKTGSLIPRPGSPSSWISGVSGQRAKAPPPICAPRPVAAAIPGSQPWPPPSSSSSRLRGNKERRRSRSSGVVGPLRLHHSGCLAITHRLCTRPPPPPVPVRALGPPRCSGPLPGPCRRPGPPPLGLSLRTAAALWAPSTPWPEPLWRAAPAFAAPTTASPTLQPPPAAPTWLPDAAMVHSTSAPKLQIRWYSPSRMATLTVEAVVAIFIKGNR